VDSIRGAKTATPLHAASPSWSFQVPVCKILTHASVQNNLSVHGRYTYRLCLFVMVAC